MAKLDDTVANIVTEEQRDEITPSREKGMSRFQKLGLGVFFGGKTKLEKKRTSMSSVLSAMSDEDRKSVTGMEDNALQKFMDESQAPMKDLKDFQSLRKSDSDRRRDDLRYAKEDRLLRQFQLENMKYYGATVNEDDIEDIRKRTGNDLNVVVETYGLEANIDPETNGRSYNIPPADVLKNKASAMILKPSEIDYLGTIMDAKDTMTEVVQGVEALGINDLSSVGTVIFDDMGPFSLPARFDLIAQFTKDPKYIGLKSKLERAFQLYRKAITGAQASDRELKMLRPLIATFKTRPEIFSAVAQDLISESGRLYSRRLSLYKGAGRDTRKLEGMIEKDANDIRPGTYDTPRGGKVTIGQPFNVRMITAPSGRVITIGGGK